MAAAINSIPPQDRRAGKGRKASREVRRAQLIDATIETLHRRGYAETTLAEVADTAGLSRGIVNFHFSSKEQLLLETLRSLSDEYSDHWRRALGKAGVDPAAQLWAVVAADFDRQVASRRKLAAWTAFMGEAKTRPAYRDLCGRRDDLFQDTLAAICTRLMPDQDAPDTPRRIAICVEAMLFGLWMQMMLTNMALTRDLAHQAAIDMLITLFPGRFDRNGPIAVDTERAKGRTAPEQGS